MSVRDLLTSMDSMEIAEWRAFERALGPIGPEYTQNVLAASHEQLQTVSWLLGSQFEENPVPQPDHWPRPPEVFEGTKEQVEAEEAPVINDAEAMNAFFDEVESA